MWEYIGKAAAVYVLTSLSLSIIRGLYGSFIASALGLSSNLKKLGKWAVVTGSTDGIGKAYAFEMARNGLNVVLISRSPYKLQNVSSEIALKYGVEVKLIDVDFTETNIYDHIKNELKDLEIGVLINNVGMSFDYPEYFTEIPESFINKLVTCNIISLTTMTKIVITGMQERKKGLIINVSSLSSLIPAPFLAVYGATKAYILSFSKSLRLETKNTGVTVQCVAPGFVVSNMSKLREPNLMAPTPVAYVRSSLKTAGIEGVTGGYYMHKLQIFFIEFADRFLPEFVLSSIVFSQLKATREKAARRKLKEAKSK